ncbi:DUF935 domain-containing protein [Thiocystis violascens]|uniref:Mu-like prophage protein gp29 n=1 Tax=Thiocystis violascens (strain ATCC 17096 / DSM 198 / 6111) TaxID=765911 RepID=I3YGV5_THIV6|nr:DUF935 family protein [Thiocystis violascens]AFL76223.1 Mu-like prophage protein gp29 [Thiocystis violascens DSM 198]
MLTHLKRLIGFAEPKRPEAREIASTLDGRDITRGYVDPLMLLLPQDDILVERGANAPGFYRQILSDAQVGATLQQRRLALLRTEWQVIPGGETRVDRQAAALIEETLERIRWDAVCAGMHYGVFYGHAVAECLWAREGSRIVLDAVRVRDRARFGFDGAQRLRLRTASQSNGELLPERKFWNFRTGADHDDEPYGLGLAHWLYWPVLFKRANIKFWLIAAEKFGSPTAMGVFPPNATAQERQQLLATLRAIQTDAGVILPEGMTIELLEAKRAGGTDYPALCAYMDAAIAKLVLGQVMTSEAVGGQYKAEVQDQVKDDLVKADADLICDSFNRSVVRWLVDWNHPGAAYPKVWRQVDDADNIPPEALNAFAMGIDRLAALMPIPASHIYRVTKIPAPAGDEPVLQSIAATSATSATSGAVPEATETPDAPDEATPTDFAEPGRADAQDLIDTEGDRDPGWDAAMTALLKPLFDALADGLTPEEILGKMDEWYPAMNDDQLTALLTQALAAADTIGRLEARDD